MIVLITSAGGKVPLVLAVRDALERFRTEYDVKNCKLIIGDSDPGCIARRFGDEFWLMPSIVKENLIQITNGCWERKIDVIIPTRDEDLEFLSSHELDYILRFLCLAMVSKFNTVNMCNDKLDFYQILEEDGFPVIPTSTDIKCLTFKYGENDDYGDEYVTKNRTGSGSKNISLKINSGSARYIINSLSPGSWIVQPFIHGKEATCDFYVDKKGKCKGVVCRWRDKVVDGESCVTTTFKNEKLEKLVVKFAEKYDFYGHCNLQVFVLKDGSFKIIECNPRFGGASTLSVQMGLDSFYWFFQECMGIETDEYVQRFNWNVKMVRHKSDSFIIGEDS